MDLDWVEARDCFGNIKIAALIEDKDDRYRITDFQRKVYHELREKIGCPWYIVYHNARIGIDRIGEWIFKVENGETGETRCMSAEEYKEFLMSLKVKYECEKYA